MTLLTTLSTLLLIWAETKIRNIRELEALQSETYVLAIATVFIFLAAALLAAQSIAYEGGKNPQDASKRRMWFFGLGIIAFLVFFTYNYFYVKSTILNAALQSKFTETNLMATLVVVVAYFSLGFVLSKVLKNAKFGTIFPSNRN
jgi:uncharacterized membrane protein